MGRSNIVGTPAAMLLQRRDATVTVVHSRTPNAAVSTQRLCICWLGRSLLNGLKHPADHLLHVQEIVSQADIVIAAVGVPEMVKGEWVKPGAAVIDVGTNAVPVWML